jgi:hypothetical protein
MSLNVLLQSPLVLRPGSNIQTRWQQIPGVAERKSAHSARGRAGAIVTSLCALAVIASFLPSHIATAADPVELGKQYPATLDYSSTPKGYDWTCGEKDVWKLTNFTLSVGEEFKVDLKSAQVVLGHHDSNVLWAAVFPDQAGEIVRAGAGQGEKVTSIWLRFHPSRLGKIFPAPSVTEQGDARFIRDAKRLAAHKMASCWQSGGRPIVPEMGIIAIDLETQEGSRRFFSIDTTKQKVEYVDAFLKRPLPVASAIGQDEALNVFDTVWEAFDREYAMFVVKPAVDWPKLRERYRPQAQGVKDDRQLAELLALMLAHLEDLHVSVQVAGVDIPVYNRNRPHNANRTALPVHVGKVTAIGRDVSWAITNDRIGYIAIDGLVDRDLPRAVREALENMDSTRGLILDLRANGGGSEPLAAEIAGWFLDRERVYAKSQYRNGPRHTDLGSPKARVIQPKSPWHYVAPVIVLQGQRTMSSAEDFVLMLSRAPQVTTMGDRTAGSSGNPRLLNAGAGITVMLPRWNDLDAEGKSIDAVGIAPGVVVGVGGDFSGDADPVLAAALKRLRAEKLEDDALRLRPGSPNPHEQPQVVSVTPARDAEGVDPVTEIRIRFDRPMDPEKFALEWKRIPLVRPVPQAQSGFRLRGEVRYDAKNYEFIFPVKLMPDVEHRLEVADHAGTISPSAERLFRSAAGVVVSSFVWQFRTGPLRGDDRAADSSVASNVMKFADDAERAAHIDNAGRSDSLRALIEKIRQRRLALKSVVEQVYDRTSSTDQSTWFQVLEPASWARFWWQGKTQFRADGSAYFFNNLPLHVGGDDRLCWSWIGNKLVIDASDSIARKNVEICDPFLADSGAFDEKVIARLQLEYLGEQRHNGALCHRLRSWVPRTKPMTGFAQSEFRDWLIDAQTLLPVMLEEFAERPLRLEFAFESIDQKLPAETFQPPKDTGLVPGKPDPLGENFDQNFVNALDGSAGRISIRWGQIGKRGNTSSSGLN